MAKGDVARLQEVLQRTEMDLEALTENVWRLAGENEELRRLVGLLADALTQVPTLLARQPGAEQRMDLAGDNFCAAILEVRLWLRYQRRTQPSNTNN